MFFEKSAISFKILTPVMRVIKTIYDRFCTLIPDVWKNKGLGFVRDIALEQIEPVVLKAEDMLHLTIQLPQIDKNLIEEVIAFQIESRLPFPISEAVYSVLNQFEEQGQLVVVVAVISRTQLKQYAQNYSLQQAKAKYNQSGESNEKSAVALSPAKALHAFHQSVELDSLGRWQGINNGIAAGAAVPTHDAGRKQHTNAVYLLVEKKNLWVAYVSAEGLRRSHLIRLGKLESTHSQEKIEPIAREIKRTLLSWSLPVSQTLYSFGFTFAECDCFATMGLQVLRLAAKDATGESDPILFGAHHLKVFSPLKDDFFSRGSLALLPQEKNSFYIFFSKLIVTLGLFLMMVSSAQYIRELGHTQRAYATLEKKLSPIISQTGVSAHQKEVNRPKTLKEWETWISRQTSPYAIEPKLPYLGEILSWIGTSVRKVGKKEKIDTHALILEEFNYEMESFPSLDKKQKSYRLRLDLQMSAPDPSIIEHVRRELESAKWVDRNKKVLWNAVGQSGYRMTLYLKPVR